MKNTTVQTGQSFSMDAKIITSFLCIILEMLPMSMNLQVYIDR